MRKILDMNVLEILYLVISQTTASSELVDCCMLFSLVTSLFSDLHEKKYKTHVIRINLNAEDLRLNYNSVPRQWTV